MNTYRKVPKILWIFLVIVFVFAASQPALSWSPNDGSRLFTSHNNLDNLAVNIIPDWLTSSLSVHTPFIGETWTVFTVVHVSKSVHISDALNVGVNEFSPHFLVPTINAP